MATKNTTFALSQNQTSSDVTSHATVSGRTVYGRIVSATETIKQSAYVPQVPKVWVKSGENSVSFYNNSRMPTTAFTFTVYVDSSTAFNAATNTVIPSGGTRDMSGTRYAVSGESYYTLHAEWNGEEGYENSTVIRWKENGVQKEEVGPMTYDFTTERYYISSDTELSDFEVEIQQEIETELTFDDGSSAKIHGGQRIQDDIFVRSLSVVFQWYDSSTQEYNQYEYVWDIDAYLGRNLYILADSPIPPVPDTIETSNPGNLVVTIESLTLVTDGIPSNLSVSAEVSTINGSDEAIRFQLDHNASIATLPAQYQGTTVVTLPEGDIGTVYDPDINITID